MFHDTISIRMNREAEQAERAAGGYIFSNGILENFGTGPNSKSTEVCNAQREYIKNKFGLTDLGFSNAFKIAEHNQRLEDAAEVAYLKSHPELNP